MRKLSITAALVVSAMVFAPGVSAQEQSQDLDVNSKVEVTCETGSYGQPVDCRAVAEASASGSQKQFIRRADGTVIEVHDMVDTGVDTTGAISIFGLLASGSVAAINKFKNRA